MQGSIRRIEACSRSRAFVEGGAHRGHVDMYPVGDDLAVGELPDVYFAGSECGAVVAHGAVGVPDLDDVVTGVVEVLDVDGGFEVAQERAEEGEESVWASPLPAPR